MQRLAPEKEREKLREIQLRKYLQVSLFGIMRKYKYFLYVYKYI